jgi:hypothetical protein
MQVVVLWKVLQYPEYCFHATNRFNSNFDFVMKGGPADDGIERIIQSRQFGEFVQLGDLIHTGNSSIALSRPFWIR